ncbi:hypothetical protein DPMN_030177 [Dreissena polymorpha]|uniref:Uncharacterized protein n=1 Tax=Dreissena polymorpha TaxID=45954 RepID=A0A9D4LXQ4_DREPO|nr:hypothetical protein DPMN_030177 [Dreissena polymorpha]
MLTHVGEWGVIIYAHKADRPSNSCGLLLNRDKSLDEREKNKPSNRGYPTRSRRHIAPPPLRNRESLARASNELNLLR